MNKNKTNKDNKDEIKIPFWTTEITLEEAMRYIERWKKEGKK